MRYCSVDLETTGLNPDTCDIIEFSAVLDDLSILDPIDKLPVFHTYFIKDNYVGEPYALSMHPQIFRRIAERDHTKYSFMSASKLGYAFRKFLVNNGYKEEHDQVVITVAGKNFPAFDLQFLNRKSDMSKHVNIRHRIIDPAILYIKPGDDAPPGMEECKRRAGMEPKVAHTAEEDAKDIIQLIRIHFGQTFVVPF